MFSSLFPANLAEILPLALMDVLALSFSILIYAGTLRAMRLSLRKNPSAAIQGISEKARRNWVASVMTEKSGILGVQTLRNSSTVASFMASTSTLLAMGVLSLLSRNDLSSLLPSAHLASGQDNPLLLAKVIVLMFDLFIAFFCFASSIRLYNHVGFMVSTSTAKKDLPVHIRLVSALLNRAARHFHLGMLAFYFMVPLVFWFFHSALLLLSTVGMVLIVRALDKTVGLSSA